MATQRSSRFASWSDLRAVIVSGKAADRQPFFAGAGADERMEEMRKAINEIRSAWERYPDFMEELRGYLQSIGVTTTDGSLDALLDAKKEWRDSIADDEQIDFSALKLYTSAHGHEEIFKAISDALRSEDLASDRSSRRAVTFLVELLTIDLFNHRIADPAADEFNGTVYRGMSVTRAELERFEEAVEGPLTERYLAIPLAMMSASREAEIALEFAIHEAERDPERQLLLWEIQVVSLASELLRAYRKRHPSSVVTSLCAVPIDTLSEYSEQEVLLRGPFLQLVRLGVDRELLPDRPVHRLHALMHNTNRDHLTAVASNLGADRHERELFRGLVLLDRYRLCADLMRESGRTVDADGYAALAAQTRAALEPNL